MLSFASAGLFPRRSCLERYVPCDYKSLEPFLLYYQIKYSTVFNAFFLNSFLFNLHLCPSLVLYFLLLMLFVAIILLNNLFYLVFANDLPFQLLIFGFKSFRNAGLVSFLVLASLIHMWPEFWVSNVTTDFFPFLINDYLLSCAMSVRCLQFSPLDCSVIQILSMHTFICYYINHMRC